MEGSYYSDNLDGTDRESDYGDDWLCPKCGSNPLHKKYFIRKKKYRSDVVVRYCVSCGNHFHYCELECKVITKRVYNCCGNDRIYKKKI